MIWLGLAPGIRIALCAVFIFLRLALSFLILFWRLSWLGLASQLGSLNPKKPEKQNPDAPKRTLDPLLGPLGSTLGPLGPPGAPGYHWVPWAPGSPQGPLGTHGSLGPEALRAGGLEKHETTSALSDFWPGVPCSIVGWRCSAKPVLD